jgi:protein-glutamine gamma-glutamyltransferase
MLWRGQNRLAFLPGTAEAQLTAVLLYLAATPVALTLASFTDLRAFVLWTLMWPVTLLPRRWWRTALLLILIPTVLALLAQLIRPPQAPFFMLVVLVLSAAEQVMEDGRPGAFNLIGVIFPALCVMVLSANVFVFLLLLVAVIFYAGVFTLRINDMPLSGLRIRLLPIVLALSGSLFFAIAAFILMPRINASAIPGLAPPEASTGVGDRLEMGKFSSVINNGEDAFRAFVETPLPQKDLYWRVHVLGRMEGASWVRDPKADRDRGQVPFDKRLYGVEETLRYGVRHARQAPKWHPVLGVPVSGRVDDNARLNLVGEYVAQTNQSVLDQQIIMQSTLKNPYQAFLPTGLQTFGQPRLQAWAQEKYAEAGSRRGFINLLLNEFGGGKFAYTLNPGRLSGEDAGKLDRFFFETRRGYCSHYAMTMATALRAAGIPANVIVGYQGGEWNSYGNYYRVRQSDAHAWVEAEVEPGLWQRFDPTQLVPDAAILFENRQLQAVSIEQQPGWRGAMRRGLQQVDAFVTRLNSDIVLYDEQARRELLSGSVLGRLISFASFWLFGTVVFVTPLLLWRWWTRRDPMLRLDQKFLALAKKYGLERPLHEGRMDFARRWAQAAPALQERIEAFADLFCRMLYAPPRSVDEALAERKELAQKLKDLRVAHKAEVAR